MRHIRHLTRSEITDIVIAFQQGEKQAELARRYEVDKSTINYHLRKFKAAYPEQGDVYAFVKADLRKTCVHPSSVCTFCGQMKDELSRAERDLIAQLTADLADATSRLRIAGLVE